MLAHGAESFLEKNLAEGLGGVRTRLRVRCRLVVVTLSPNVAQRLPT